MHELTERFQNMEYLPFISLQSLLSQNISLNDSSNNTSMVFELEKRDEKLLNLCCMKILKISLLGSIG